MAAVAPVNLHWWRWLVVATLGVLLFGATLVLAPALALRLFGMLLFAAPDGISRFGAAPVAYIALTHAVLGAVMIGWAVLMLYALFGPFRRGEREAWRMLAVSLAAWFVPDTAYSLWSGFWQNAVLNLGFALAFAIPLAATHRSFHRGNER